MVKVLLLLLFLLIPFSADASYKIYLKNGSVIPGVSSYERKDGEVTVYFGGGSMGVPEKEILKIEKAEAPEQDFRRPVESGVQEEGTALSMPSVDAGNKGTRKDALHAELDSVNSEIQTVEGDEVRVVQAINDRKGARLTYNALQLRQLENDLAPLQQELSDLQVKKGALYQRKSTIENELQSLE